MYQPCELFAVEPKTSFVSLKAKPQVLLEVLVIHSSLLPSALNLKNACPN